MAPEIRLCSLNITVHGLLNICQKENLYNKQKFNSIGKAFIFISWYENHHISLMATPIYLFSYHSMKINPVYTEKS
jgi:hypothetical protein